MTVVAGPEAARASRPARARLLNRRLPLWAEAVLAVLGYELYGLVQAATDADRAVAVRHGWDIIALEQRLHLWVEPVVNGWISGHHVVALGADYYYELAHPFVTGLVLGWLWWRRRSFYAGWRNVLLGISLAALVVFWACPVAPPRLTTSAVSDTLVRYDALGAAHVHHGLVDLYAALPSLHVAWACWCAAAVVLTSRARWRWLAVTYPLATTAVVLATANHYVIDVIAGAALALAAVAVAHGLRPGRVASGRGAAR